MVITHEHPDHCVDIYGLHVLLRYGARAHGRAGVRARRAPSERLGTLAHWGDTFDWHAIEDGDKARGRLHRPRASPGPTTRRRPTRCEATGPDGRRIVYTVGHRPRLERRRVRAGGRARAVGGALPARRHPDRRSTSRRTRPASRPREAAARSGSCSPTSGPGSTRRLVGRGRIGGLRRARSTLAVGRPHRHRDLSRPIRSPEPRRSPWASATTGASPTSCDRSRSPATSPELAMGSVLVEMGRTRVLCTASVEERVPPWLRGNGQGLGDRGVLDAARLDARARVDREAAKGKQSGRTQEIQRLIGRSLRAVTDLADARRGADHGRLRRAAGRRWHPHRVDLRRVPRAARRLLTARGGEEDRRAPRSRTCARRSRSASSTRCRAWTSTTRRTRPPRST